MRVLLTSGGTRVPIDRVRHIGNMSRGTFGSRIALELLRLNGRSQTQPIDELHFLHARGSRRPFGVELDLSEITPNDPTLGDLTDELDRMANEFDQIGGPLRQHEYSEFNQYRALLEHFCRSVKPDLIILAAAVSDFLVSNYVDGKVRTGDGLQIELVPAPKLIGMIKHVRPECKLVGFKLLVDSTDEELEAAARQSIEVNRCDLVVANDLRDIKADAHRVMLVRPGKATEIFESDPDDPNRLARVVANFAMNTTVEGG